MRIATQSALAIQRCVMTPAKQTVVETPAASRNVQVCLLRCGWRDDQIRDVLQNSRDVRADRRHRRSDDEHDQPRDQPVFDGCHALAIAQETLCESFHLDSRTSFIRSYTFCICRRGGSVRGPLISHSRSRLLHRTALLCSRPSIKRLHMSSLFDNSPPSSISEAFGFYSLTIIFKRLFAALNLIPYTFLPLIQINGSSCVATHRNNHKLDSLH